jgi:hypothetical protein
VAGRASLGWSGARHPLADVGSDNEEGKQE